ncbi:MAG: hypothetical protein ACFFCT_12140 [Candidatus Odinarchaeota archaeon]
MGDQKALCPHCEKKSASLDFATDGTLKNIKGASWAIPLIEVESGKWKQDLNIGTAIHCKCGHHYFIHSIQKDPISFEIGKSIPSGQYLPVYCENCAQAFIDSTMKCPNCGKQY